MTPSHRRNATRSWILAAIAAFDLLTPSFAQPVVHEIGGGKYRVTFAYVAPPGTKSVHLAGSFNGWSQTATPMAGPGESGQFTLMLELGQGRHEYKFVLDGARWETDPGNPVKTEGYQNAVLALGVPADSPIPANMVELRPVDMPPVAEHPALVRELLKALEGTPPEQRRSATEAWLERHPTPIMTPDTVTFLSLKSPSFSRTDVRIFGSGFQMSFDCPSLADPRGLMGVTIRRDRSLMGATYEFKRRGLHGAGVGRDHFAWSQTSRAGKPVSLIVEPSEHRGRILVLSWKGRPAPCGLAGREVYVYLPPGYEGAPDQKYPVLYVHDGQNMWDDPVEPFGHGGWHLNETADRLIREGRIEPFIAVAIANSSNRIEEYGPGGDILAAGVHPYADSLIQDVKPNVDSNYRTNPGPEHTFLMGSSLGGVISFQIALRHPDVFGGAACLSSAFWFTDKNGKGYFDLLAQVGKQPVRLYIDSGTAGEHQDGAADTRRMAKALREAGWKDGEDFMHLEVEGAEHNERAWRARLDKPLLFLLETSKRPNVQTSKPEHSPLRGDRDR